MTVSPPVPASTPGRSATPGLRALRALPFAVVCVAVSALGHDLAGGGAVPCGTLLLSGLAVWALAAVLAGRERSMPSIAAGLAVGQLGLHLLFHRLAMSGGGMAGMGGMNGMADMPGMGGGATGSAAHSGSGALAALAAKLLCGPGGAPAGLTLPPGSTAAQIVSRAGIDPHLVLASTPQLPGWAHTAYLGLTPLMLLGHLLAAVVAGWWLRRGEAAVWRVLRVTAQLTETLAQTWSAPLRTLLALAAGWLRGLLGQLGPDAGARFRPMDGEVRVRLRTTWLRHQLIRRGPPSVLAA
ncbi:hypothetical protein ACEZDB_10825 [Streptacidiphilus sp. N1-3]|uniref:Integral membrane protein n=1 Tax=Streptacidiphilus alkalitolerans TaxID=3342712 RepID=A0ABV6WYM5_9ACTN